MQWKVPVHKPNDESYTRQRLTDALHCEEVIQYTYTYLYVFVYAFTGVAILADAYVYAWMCLWMDRFLTRDICILRYSRMSLYAYLPVHKHLYIDIDV